MEFQDILTLIEKVSRSSLTQFSMREDENGIQIEMRKESRRDAEEGAEAPRTEERKEQAQELSAKKEEETSRTQERGASEDEREILSPMDGIFRYIEEKGALLRVGKELNDEDGVEIGSILDEEEMPYNLSVKCLGEVTGICVQDGQRVKKGDPLFTAKIKKGDITVDVL